MRIVSMIGIASAKCGITRWCLHCIAATMIWNMTMAGPRAASETDAFRPAPGNLFSRNMNTRI